MGKAKAPGHYTDKGTRKFQANGPIAWAGTFQAAAGEGREGEGIRSAMAFAVAHRSEFLAWAKADAKERAQGAAKAPKAKAPKAKAKAPKAPKAPKAKAKAPKAPKAPKTGEQTSIPEVK